MYITHDLWRLHGIPSLFLSFFSRVFLYISPLGNFLMRIDDNLLSYGKKKNERNGWDRLYLMELYVRASSTLSLFP